MPDYFPVSAKLFNDPPDEPAKGRLLQGNVFDDSFLELSETVTPSEGFIDLQSISSLNPLRGRARVIIANAFFHLFDEDLQAELARRCASLLSKKSGSVLLGSHLGLSEAGFRKS